MPHAQTLNSLKRIVRSVLFVTLATTFVFLPACRPASEEGLAPDAAPSATDTSGAPKQTAASGEENGSPSGQPSGVLSEQRGPAIAFEGRIDAVTNPNAPIMGWAGSRVRIGFSGTKLSVNLAGLAADGTQGPEGLSNNYVAISIDQGAARVMQLQYGAQNLTLADGLSRGQHEVTLTKRTEGEFGAIQLLGTSTDGTLTDTTPWPTRHIEVVGDSGATGWGAQGILGDANICASSAGAQNAAVAFPAVAGKLLAAAVHNTSYAGKGLVQNRDVANDAVKTMPKIWTRRLPQSLFPVGNAKDAGAWDPNAWIPDAMVLVVSGNDFYANGGPSQDTFETTVAAFVTALRAQYSAVHVYIMVSPMLHNVTYANGGYTPTARTDALSWSRSAVASLGDARVHFVDMAEDNGVQGLSCDYHMTPATHQAVAKILASAMAADLGW